MKRRKWLLPAWKFPKAPAKTAAPTTPKAKPMEDVAKWNQSGIRKDGHILTYLFFSLFGNKNTSLFLKDKFMNKLRSFFKSDKYLLLERNCEG